MKKLLVVLVLVLVSLVGYTQELKGIEIGSKGVSQTVETTVAGIEGVIFTYVLNDGRIYQMIFVPSEGEKTRRVYSSDIDALKNAIENKYKVSLKKRTLSDYSDDYIYYAKTEKTNFYISVESNRYMTPPCKLSFIIADISLSKIHDQEEKAKTADDI